MLSGEKVSIQSIVARVYRNFNFQESSRDIDMYEWIGDGLAHIGYYGQFDTKEAELEVEDYQACLPLDFYKIEQVAYLAAPLDHATGSFDHRNCREPNPLSGSLPTYKISRPYIRVNFRDASLRIAYTAIEVDKEGFPLIPDEISYKEALFYYCAMMLQFPAFVSGKPNTFKEMELRWLKYCGQAQAKAKMPNIDKMNRIANQWNRLIPDRNLHNEFFRHLGKAA